MSTGNRTLGWAIAVAALGLLLSLALRYESARHALTGEASHCTLSESVDCDRVQASSYARAFGVPLSTWGAAGFFFCLVLLVHARGSGGGLVAFAGLFALCGTLGAAYLAYVSWFVIGALCLYCTGMQMALLLLLLLLARPAWAARGEVRKGTLLVRAALPLAVLVGVSVLGERAFAASIGLRQSHARTEIAAMRIDVSDAMVLGNPETEHSVVIYYDFSCPYCKACYETARELVRRYPESVHYLFKHFPLDKECNSTLARTVHPGSCRAALAGTGAQRHGDASKALAFLFDRQEFFPEVLDEALRVAGVPKELWREVLEGEETAAVLKRDVAEGNAMHFGHVPNIFLDGHPIDPDRLAQRVKRLAGR